MLSKCCGGIYHRSTCMHTQQSICCSTRQETVIKVLLAKYTEQNLYMHKAIKNHSFIGHPNYMWSLSYAAEQRVN